MYKEHSKFIFGMYIIIFKPNKILDNLGYDTRYGE